MSAGPSLLPAEPEPPAMLAGLHEIWAAKEAYRSEVWAQLEREMCVSCQATLVEAYQQGLARLRAQLAPLSVPGAAS